MCCDKPTFDISEYDSLTAGPQGDGLLKELRAAEASGMTAAEAMAILKEAQEKTKEQSWMARSRFR